MTTFSAYCRDEITALDVKVGKWLSSTPETRPYKKNLIEAAQTGNVESVTKLLAMEDNPSFDNNRAIKEAAKNGHNEVIKLFVSDGRCDAHGALTYACQGGHIETVTFLLDHCQISENDWAPLRSAMKHRHTSIVQLLYDTCEGHVDLSYGRYVAVDDAITDQNHEILKILLPAIPVDDIVNHGLCGVVSRGGPMVYTLLHNDPRVVGAPTETPIEMILRACKGEWFAYILLFVASIIFPKLLVAFGSFLLLVTLDLSAKNSWVKCFIVGLLVGFPMLLAQLFLRAILLPVTYRL